MADGCRTTLCGSIGNPRGLAMILRCPPSRLFRKFQMKIRRRFHRILVLMAILSAPLLADDEHDHDHSNDQIARPGAEMGEGLGPAKAAAAMTVPPGFNVQLAAGEPMVHQPIAMCFDHRGRLWVAEGHTYPRRAPDGQGKDRILIFEDTTGDGLFDKSTTFIEGLNLVSGLEVGFGGVYVGAAPYLLFIPDADFDDKPDPPTSDSPTYDSSRVQFPNDVPPGATVLLDGFGWHDTHETLNAFIWGPDGWLYGCHGVFTHSNVGKPETPTELRTGLNAGVWRYHPVRHEFEVFAHGTSNPWGVDFNDRGQAFISACVIPHLWHMVQGGRYHRQGGRHFNEYTFDDIKTIADHGHFVGNIKDHAWWGHEPKAAGATSAAGGGHAHCGLMCYRGDNWPEIYRNQLFFNNIHGNRINSDVLEKVTDGSGYVGHHGDDFLFANDHYYRGINLRYGPDGSVYLIDWYDKNACHRTNPEVWDRSNGRIFLISFGDCKPKSVDLQAMPSLELVKLLSHKNNWYVTMARRILQHRGVDSDVADAILEQLADVSDLDGNVHNERIYLNGLWALHSLDMLDEANGLELTGMFSLPSEYISAWCIQMELEDADISVDRLQELVKVATRTDSAVVRMYAASALQRMPLEQRWELADALLQHSEDAEDHNIPLLLWYAVEPLVPEDSGRAMQLAIRSKIPSVRRFLVRRAAADQTAIASVVDVLEQTSDTDVQSAILDEMLASFEGRVAIPMPDSWNNVYEKLTTSDQQSLSDKADQLAILFGDERVFPGMRQLLQDASADSQRRRQALDVLIRGQDLASADVLLSDSVLLNQHLQSAAVRGLATIGNEEAPRVLLKRYSGFPESVQKDVVSTLVSRPIWATALLNAIGSKDVSTSDLHAYHVRQIQTFKSESLNKLLVENWGKVSTSNADRQLSINKWKSRLTPASLKQADLGNGRRIYARTCQTCHQLFGTGGSIGPEITGSNRSNLDYLLENILDPSALVGRNYQVTLVVLNSGQVVSGILKKETDSALTIQTLNDQMVVAKSDIEERELLKTSMMPEKQLDSLSEAHVRDLFAYLQSPEQVAMSGPRATIDPKSGRVAGALEGESLKVIEKSGGSVRDQDMAEFRDDRWSGNKHLWWTGGKPKDRLSVEIPAVKQGTYDLEVVLTKARDYAVVELQLNGKTVDPAIDCFDAKNVITTGVLTYPGLQLPEGSSQLTLVIRGANAKAVKGYMVAVDFVKLVPAVDLE